MDEISEFLLFTVTDGGHFEFYTLENAVHLFKRGVGAYFFIITLSYLKQPSNVTCRGLGHGIMVFHPTNSKCGAFGDGYHFILQCTAHHALS